MGTDRDAFYLDGWGYDRLQAQNARPIDRPGQVWLRTPSEIETDLEALREEIASQAEVIEAQDMQIEALQEERAELLAELDAFETALDSKNRLLGRTYSLLGRINNE
jgi:chromosome segregation ATPase